MDVDTKTKIDHLSLIETKSDHFKIKTGVALFYIQGVEMNPLNSQKKKKELYIYIIFFLLV